ncbi:MAG: restriction endonuclease [Bacilli bacterium]
MAVELNDNIEFIEKKFHSKASEEYVSVVFSYDKYKWEGWVPIVYRRTGLFLEAEDDIKNYLNIVYEEMNPKNYFNWLKQQEIFWSTEKANATVTKPFFDSLVKGGWQCIDCSLPKNPNWARRIQDLKEFGYTLATDTKRYCNNCKSNKTHIIMLPITRGNLGGNGYESWSPQLRKRILKLLNEIDVYEDKRNIHCLPDHKFSEIRWDHETKTENPNDMTDAEIQEKFQLLSNQRNQQKREVCRTCYQTGKRGIIFGIPYFYAGDENWDESIPKTGKLAEKGCYGCPWYDIDKWRKELINLITKDEGR